MRLVFFGSPRFAVPSLAALIEAGHDVALVVTQPDRPAGRGQHEKASAIASFAQSQGLEVWQTSTLKGAADRLRPIAADAMALAAFGALVPQEVLGLADRGILNVHPSLLPRWRGASPIQAALLAGDAETGVSIIRLVKAMDAGPVLLQEVVPIRPEDDSLSLEKTLSELGARLLVRALAEHPPERAQDDSLATYCKRIEREEARIDWTRPAEEIGRQVRAYRGWPQAFTTWNGKVLKILRATPTGEMGEPGSVYAEFRVGTAEGCLRVAEVVLEGRRPQSAAEFLRGYPGVLGARLG